RKKAPSCLPLLVPRSSFPEDVLMRRVVVTGLGVVSPNGIGKEAFWSACVAGKSGVGPIRSFDASGHPVRIAAEVPDFDIQSFVPPEHRKHLKIMGRASRFGVAASAMALADSGLEREDLDPTRVGVVMGAGLVPIVLPDLAPLLKEALDAEGKFQPNLLGERGRDGLFPLWLLKYLPNMAAAHISLLCGAQGPNNTVVTACAAGT